MTYKPWTPDRESELRQQAIEKAEAEQKRPGDMKLLPELSRCIPESEYQRLLKTISDQADAIERLTDALPQPPKDGVSER